MLLSRILLPSHRIHNVLAIEHADEPIDPRRIRKQFRFMPLHQTPRHDHAPALPLHLHPDRIPNLRKRFRLRRFQKPACIDHDRIRVRGIRRDLQAILCQQPEHPLAVHEVLRASQADKGDFLDRLGRVFL